MRPRRRIPRQLGDLVASLRRHVELLKEFSEKAFGEAREEYLGEVAGKLRLLILEKGRNKPLLLLLMDEFGFDLPITLDGPPIRPSPGQPGADDRVSLRQFLGLLAYGMRVPGGEFVTVTKAQLIEMWAAQHGAAHEDWSLTEEFAAARDSGIFIGGRSALAAELQTTTRAVLAVAERVLSALTPEMIADRDAARRRDP